MIDLIFQKEKDNVAIRVKGNNLTFAIMKGQIIRFSPIEGLRLNIGGILKEFPDLEGKSEKTIQKEGLKRFKEHIRSIKSENKIVLYLKKDLEKHGYKLRIIKKEGFRPQKVK